MTDEQFEALVVAGIEALPAHVREKMQNVAIVIDDDMSAEARMEYGHGADDVVFGLYEGVPLTERGSEYFALPDKITIFKNSILAAYRDPADIRTCVSNTVWHEVAHHFGFGEEWVAREEYRRGKTM